jgi:amino acid transporter
MVIVLWNSYNIPILLFLYKPNLYKNNNMSLSSWEIAVWILVAILVYGVITYGVGYLSDSQDIEKKGKNAGWIAISGLIIVFIVYSKVKEFELEGREISAIDNFLSKK